MKIETDDELAAQDDIARMEIADLDVVIKAIESGKPRGLKLAEASLRELRDRREVIARAAAEVIARHQDKKASPAEVSRSQAEITAIDEEIRKARKVLAIQRENDLGRVHALLHRYFGTAGDAAFEGSEILKVHRQHLSRLERGAELAGYDLPRISHSIPVGDLALAANRLRSWKASK